MLQISVANSDLFGKSLYHRYAASDYIINGEYTEERVEVIEAIIDVLENEGHDEEARQVKTATIAKGGHWGRWAKQFGTFLGRYERKGLEPTYKTKTCEVWKAKDVLDNDRKVSWCISALSIGLSFHSQVALKISTQAAIEREALMRQNLETDLVIPILRIHVPESQFELVAAEAANLHNTAGIYVCICEEADTDNEDKDEDSVSDDSSELSEDDSSEVYDSPNLYKDDSDEICEDDPDESHDGSKQVTQMKQVPIFSSPSMDAKDQLKAASIGYESAIEVSEVVVGADGVEYLKLADGRGYCPMSIPDGDRAALSILEAYRSSGSLSIVSCKCRYPRFSNLNHQRYCKDENDKTGDQFLTKITDKCQKCYDKLDEQEQAGFHSFPPPRQAVFQLKEQLNQWHGVNVALSEGEFVQVMDWADATLDDEMRKKQIAGTDTSRVVHILQGVGQALQHMHKARQHNKQAKAGC